MKNRKNKVTIKESTYESILKIIGFIVIVILLCTFLKEIVSRNMHQDEYKDLGILPLYEIDKEPEEDYAWDINIPYGILKEYRKYRSKGYKGVIYTYNENSIKIEPLTYNTPAIIVNNDSVNEKPSIYYDEEGVNVYGYEPFSGAFQKTLLENADADPEILSPNSQVIPISANSIVCTELKEGYYLSIDKDGQPSVYRGRQKLENCFEYINEGEKVTRIYVSNYNVFQSHVIMLYTDAEYLYIPYVWGRKEFDLLETRYFAEEQLDEYSYEIKDMIYEFKNYICLDNFKFPVFKEDRMFFNTQSVYIPWNMGLYKEYILEDYEIFDEDEYHLKNRLIY